MELEVMRLLAGEARAAGRDPASDPIPGSGATSCSPRPPTRRPVAWPGPRWLVERAPGALRAAGAINEAGGVAVDVGGARLYPIQVAEKGYAVYRITSTGRGATARCRATDNAAILRRRGRSRASQRRSARPADPTCADASSRAAAGAAEPIAAASRASCGPWRAAIRARPPTALGGLCFPICVRARSTRLMRDTISPNVLHGGVKFNIIPGEATLDIDFRRLPARPRRRRPP